MAKRLIPVIMAALGLCGCSFAPSTPAEWAAAAYALQPADSYQPALRPALYSGASVPVMFANPVPIADTCGMMGCPHAAEAVPRWVPYTAGGGNPGGYGLLVP